MWAGHTDHPRSGGTGIVMVPVGTMNFFLLLLTLPPSSPWWNGPKKEEKKKDQPSTGQDLSLERSWSSVWVLYPALHNEHSDEQATSSGTFVESATIACQRCDERQRRTGPGDGGGVTTGTPAE